VCVCVCVCVRERERPEGRGDRVDEQDYQPEVRDHEPAFKVGAPLDKYFLVHMEQFGAWKWL